MYFVSGTGLGARNLGVTKQATEFISTEAHIIRETHKCM